MNIHSLQRLFVLASTTLVLILFGCDQGPKTQKGEMSALSSAYDQQEAMKKNRALKMLARSYAMTLDELEMRQVLKAELEKRYTGAPEALYQRIKDRIVSGVSFQRKLGNGYAQYAKRRNKKPVKLSEAVGSVKRYVKEVPKLHLAMPLHIGQWDARNEIPLVSYMPVTKDENKEKSFQVEAYDETGQAHLVKVGLDDVYHANSGESVTRPIIVLAVNERTDAEGNVLPAYQKEITVTPPGDGGGGGGSTCVSGASRESGDVEEIYSVNVSADNEYAYLEPAEISFRVFTHSGTMLKDESYTDPEPQNEWHECKDSDGRDVVQKILRWYWDDYGDYILVDWYEHDDAGSVNATLSYTFPDGVSISVGYEKTDDDDPMGRTLINKDDPATDVHGARDIDVKTQPQD